MFKSYELLGYVLNNLFRFEHSPGKTCSNIHTKLVTSEAWVQESDSFFFLSVHPFQQKSFVNTNINIKKVENKDFPMYLFKRKNNNNNNNTKNNKERKKTRKDHMKKMIEQHRMKPTSYLLSEQFSKIFTVLLNPYTYLLNHF